MSSFVGVATLDPSFLVKKEVILLLFVTFFTPAMIESAAVKDALRSLAVL